MEIEQLNALMFDAEAHRDCEGLPWDEFLGHVLANDFALRRSAASKPLEDREHLHEGDSRCAAPGKDHRSGSVRIWQSDTLRSISSDVELEARPEQFTNSRVFTAGGTYGWLCNRWQVTTAQPDTE